MVVLLVVGLAPPADAFGDDCTLYRRVDEGKLGRG